MTASRLLILGALRRIQPAHGYQVRQELELWEADKWANIAYGSIYHALHTMAEEDLLQMHEVAERKGGATKKVYSLTADGENEYMNLLREFWYSNAPVYDPFQIALSFRYDLSAREFKQALGARVAATKGAIEHLRQRQVMSPPHIAANLDLTISQLEVFIAWAEKQMNS